MNILVKKRWGEFCKVFGASSRNRVIELFLAGREIDFPVGYIASETGLTRATAYTVVNRLSDNGYLVKSRKVSGIQFYRLDLDNPEVKLLVKAFNMVLDNIVKEYEVRKKVVLSSKKVQRIARQALR